MRRLLAVAQVQGTLRRDQFGFLVDPTRKIFSIGYGSWMAVSIPSAYDLIASEARLASFIAIAKGDVSRRQWSTSAADDADRARLGARVSVRLHVRVPDAGARDGLPARKFAPSEYRLCAAPDSYGTGARDSLGHSESPTNCAIWIDLQYSNSDVRGWGLSAVSARTRGRAVRKRAGRHDRPGAAARNLSRLVEAGGARAVRLLRGVDYTRSRVPDGKPMAVVSAYMAHHQGMTLLALVNGSGRG